MDKQDVKTAVRTTLAAMKRLAGRTRTQADDLMVSLLTANEDRLSDAVADLLDDPAQPPSDEQIAAALARVGIHVK